MEAAIRYARSGDVNIAFQVTGEGAFDLVLVDGRARLGCVVSALPKLRPEGVLLLDNSEREDAIEACALLADSGWSARHFSGPGPCSRWPVFWRTSAFSKLGSPPA